MFKLIGVAACTVALGVAAGVATAGPTATASKVVYHSRLKGGNNEIFVVGSAGGAPTRLTRSRAADSNPTLSPDGRRVAFESNRLGNWRSRRDSDIFVMRIDGSGVRELTFSNAFDGDPAWSRRNQVAFESERAGNSDVWVMNADGSNEQQLTTSRYFDGDPAWSPDGKKIAFTSERDNGDREIYVMNADGTGTTRLTSSPGFDENPSWSPDGTSIAFDSMRDGNLEVYVMDPDGSNQQRVTNHPALDALPSWSPDSAKLVFVSERIGKGQRRLYTVYPDGTGVRMLTKGGFDMSPDWARG